MRILLIGNNGQVGFMLESALSHLGTVVSVGRSVCDLNRLSQIRQVIAENKPDIIINSAAYTAVDKAESEPELANQINGVAPGVIGEEAARLGALVIHYSTDYVFDGNKREPYIESDPTNPLSVYGKSKLAGEQTLAESGAEYLIFRTSWVFGPHGNNFIKTILRLAEEKNQINIVSDQIGAPTSAILIAETTAAILEKYNQLGRPSGIYHLTAGGKTNWCDYAQFIVEKAWGEEKKLTLKKENIYPIPTESYPLPASRPKNSILSTKKLQSIFNISLPDWREGVSQVFNQIL